MYRMYYDTLFGYHDRSLQENKDLKIFQPRTFFRVPYTQHFSSVHCVRFHSDTFPPPLSRRSFSNFLGGMLFAFKYLCNGKQANSVTCR